MLVILLYKVGLSQDFDSFSPNSKLVCAPGADWVTILTLKRASPIHDSGSQETPYRTRSCETIYAVIGRTHTRARVLTKRDKLYDSWFARLASDCTTDHAHVSGASTCPQGLTRDQFACCSAGVSFVHFGRLLVGVVLKHIWILL